jgi:hypothetical protein
MPIRAAFVYAVLLVCCSSLGYAQNPQAAIGDLNGDAKPDVVVANPSLNNIGVFLNAGGGTLGPGTFLAAPGPQTLSLADINGDGHLDIVLVATDANSNPHLQVMLGDGNGNFATPAEIPTGAGGPISNAVVADFNGDGHLDVAFGINKGLPQVAIIFGDGHGAFSAPRIIPVASDTTNVFNLVLLDANKDSKPDLAVNTARVVTGFLHESFLLINDGTANFSVSSLTSAGFTGDTAGWVTTAADFDNDGFLDLLFGLGSAIFITFGDGHGGALSTALETSAFLTPEGFAADVDGNQTADLVSPRLGSYFPGNGHGGFGNPISLGLPQGSTLIAGADMNGDSKPDFVVQSGSNVAVVLNSLTAPASISASTALQLTASATTTSVGLPVILSASLVSYGGTPAGSVTFFDGAQSLGSAAVNPYGIAAITTSFSTAGLHNNLTASFTGVLNAGTNTFFLSSNDASDPRSISVNTSQPTASAPALLLLAFPNPARVRNPVHVSAQVTVSGTPTGSIVFTADGDVLGVAPVLGVGTGLDVTFPTLGPHNIKAIYGGDATFPQATSATVVENILSSIPADFSIDASPLSATIKAGQSATFTITINPIGDLASTVGFSCSGLPAASTCSFSPATLTPGINPVSTTLTVTTTAPSAIAPLHLRQPGPLFWLFVVAGSFSLSLLALFRRNAVRRAALAWTAIVVVSLLGSCGGGSGPGTGPGSNGTPPGASSITVTATSATSHTSALTITVTP